MKKFLAVSVLFTAALGLPGAASAAKPLPIWDRGAERSSRVIDHRAASAKPWPFWDKAAERSNRVIDHRTWDLLLKKHVVINHPSGINRFRYGDVKKSDRKALKRYIRQLSKIDPRDYCRAEQKAYWVNLYNALLVQRVLEDYPVKKITDVGHRGPWNEKMVKVAGKKLSLNDIEHRILRPIWKDHKIHFALVDGSLGAPNLQPQAYTARNMRALLRQAAREYINHPRGVELEKGKMRASSLFSDHQSDFAKTRAGLLKLLACYVDDRKALYLLGFQGNIEYHNDWALNAP